MNEIKKYIIIFLFVFCFFTGFWARGKVFNDKSEKLLQSARQELEFVRCENIELRKKLELSIERIDNIKGIIERSRNDNRESKEIIRQSKQILTRLVETIQEIENIIYNDDSNFK